MTVEFSYEERKNITPGRLYATVQFKFSQGGKVIDPDDYRKLISAAKTVKEVFTKYKEN